MVANFTAKSFKCVSKTPVVYGIILACIATPFQILIMKVLIQRLYLALPRHKILLNLSISNSINIIATPVLLFFTIPFELKTSSLGCHIIHQMVAFVAAVTIVVASGSTIALSIERYIACIHCFRVYTVVTDKRALRGLVCLWLTALATGFSCISPNAYPLLPLTEYMDLKLRLVYTLTVFPSTAVLLFVQIRLFALARKKIRTVNPSNSYGRSAELADLRRRQWKLNIAASALVGCYLVCACPLAIYITFDAIMGVQTYDKLEPLIILSTLNMLLNPFIYGI